MMEKEMNWQEISKDTEIKEHFKILHQYRLSDNIARAVNLDLSNKYKVVKIIVAIIKNSRVRCRVIEEDDKGSTYQHSTEDSLEIK